MTFALRCRLIFTSPRFKDANVLAGYQISTVLGVSLRELWQPDSLSKMMPSNFLRRAVLFNFEEDVL